MINVNSLEIHASYHCNLSCRGCMHLSPLEMHNFPCPEALQRDLNILSSVLHANVLRLLGGEPLLNPALPRLIAIAQGSGIANRLCLSTNGILLPQWASTSVIWEALNECEITLYRNSAVWKLKMLKLCTELSLQYGTLFYLYECDAFRFPGTIQPITDAVLVQRIFDSCLIAKQWQCFNLFEGFFFLCPQAMAFSRHIQGGDFEGNGFLLKQTLDIEQRLENYIVKREILPACAHCYGGCGRLLPHKNVSKAEFLSVLQGSDWTRDIDHEFLRELESGTKSFSSLLTIPKTYIVQNGQVSVQTT